MPATMRTKALDGMRVKNLAGEIRLELEPETARPFNLQTSHPIGARCLRGSGFGPASLIINCS